MAGVHRTSGSSQVASRIVLTFLRLVKRTSSLGLVVLAVSMVASVTAVLVGPQLGAIASSTSGTEAELELRSLGRRSEMYAADGTFLTFLVEEQNRELVELDQIPREVIWSVLAMEDFQFYEHNGINPRGTFRALVENLNAGGIAQGGSTITQQLVKNAILDNGQNLDRKTTEAFYALRLEKQLTKDEILERYLNTVYFGSSAYGVQAAAETYWGIDVEDLTWEHGAMLAGLIRSPNGNDPTLHAVAARNRRSVVADRLLSLELVTKGQAAQIKRAPVPAERQTPESIKPNDYIVQEALEALLNDPQFADSLGADKDARRQNIYFGGLKIYTTLSPEAQAAALASREKLLPTDSRGFTLALAAMETQTGAVRALVGGPDFSKEKFNLATQGLRQPGSSMKTFVLAAAFEAGYSPGDLIRGDSPCQFKNPGGFPNPYKVRGGGGGVQSITSITKASNNCGFVRLGQVVGNQKVIDVAQSLGISTPLEAVLSLPLGSKEVYAMEMAAAYAAIANDGVYNAPYYVEKIEDSNGELVYEHRPEARRAISSQSARMITQVLESNVRNGTGTNARIGDGHAAGGKTGTAQNYEDAWFVGFTEHLSTAVWMGHPDLKVPMRNVPGWGNMFGGKVPAAVFGDFNRAYHENLEPLAFPDPDSYGGGNYLKVKGEIDYCNSSDWFKPVKNTELVDSNGDGTKDCFRPITTTTACPDGSQPILPEGAGPDDVGLCPTTTTAPPPPPPTTPAPTAPPTTAPPPPPPTTAAPAPAPTPAPTAAPPTTAAPAPAPTVEE